MNQTQAIVVNHAMDYAARGWRVVPLHNQIPGGACSCRKGQACESAGKHPRPTAWQKAATTDEEVVAGWWEKWPLANVGVALGKDSMLIDIEADSPAEEQTALKLFGGEMPVTCCFRSSRGKHWLFKWRDGLPPGAVHKLDDLALRIGNTERGAMSVFPPSLHPSGCRYEWLVSPDEAEPADLPDEVVARLANWEGEVPREAAEVRDQEHWDRILQGVPSGHRNEDMASYIGKLLRNQTLERENLDFAYATCVAINRQNQPPLGDDELRKTFLSILRKEQNRRTTEEVKAALPEPPVTATIAKPDMKSMALVIVRSDPPMYELHAPQFHKAPGGCILLTAEQVISPRCIKIEALRQADYPLPKGFTKMWDGHGKEQGLYEKLVFYAEERDAPQEKKRHLVIAERLLAKIQKARVLEDGQVPDSRGKPCQLPDGSIVFGFTYIWEEMHMGADKIGRGELSDVLDRIGARIHGHKRLKKLTTESIGLLNTILQG